MGRVHAVLQAGCLLGCGLLLSACGQSAAPAASSARLNPAPGACASPLPAVAMDESLVDNIPQDSDPRLSPAPQTTIYFTVMLPQRCSGDRFPVIVQSPGYGGSRLTTLASNGDLEPGDASFASMDELAQALPYHGYILVSVDDRGLGESQPRHSGGYARLQDPAAETQDFRALIDWLYDNADTFYVQKQSGTGIAKDITLGTLGYSYGGGAQLPLAALDPRVDAAVPVAAWHDILYSLIPGQVVKQSWIQILCLFAVTPSSGSDIGAVNTPLQHTLCNSVAIRSPDAFQVRTLTDLVEKTSAPHSLAEPVSEDRLLSFFYTHSMAYFRNQQAAGAGWGFGESTARLRAVPTLLIQGNRDNLFNLTDAYLNLRYFGAAGGDVRLLTMEGGHMNPLANQVEGTANCGGVDGVSSALAWFDHYLKDEITAAYQAIPGRLCLSIADTLNAPAVPAVGLLLKAMPVGSLSGTGSVPARLDQLKLTVPALSTGPQFVPVVTISGGDKVLAGIPTIGNLEVTAGTGATHIATALVGVGIRRGAQTFLVDDQLSGFVEGQSASNWSLNEGDPNFLPGIGEQLQDGDQVGLLFYEQHVQYSTVVSADGLTGAPGVINYLRGKPLPNPIASSLDPVLNLVTDPNPYSVTASDIELPILIPGSYPGSSLSLPASASSSP